MFLFKRYFFIFLSLAIIINASENSRFNKDFFDELGIKNTPIIIKKNKQIEIESNEINENISWRLFQMLLIDKDFTDEKIYRGGIESLGLEYMDQSRYHHDSQKIPYISKEELPFMYRYYVERYSHFITQKYEGPWYMKFINEKIGYGIYAAADIKNGDFVGDYVGIIYDSSIASNSEFSDLRYTWALHHPLDPKGPHFFITAVKHCNFMRYINHSFDPNVAAIPVYMEGQWHQTYVACKDIKKDEQILANYGTGYWQNRTCEELH